MVIDSILQSHYKRAALIQNYRSVIASFKIDKDSGSFSSNKRNLDDKFKSLGGKVSQLVKDLQPTDSDGAAKVRVYSEGGNEVNFFSGVGDPKKDGRSKNSNGRELAFG